MDYNDYYIKIINKSNKIKYEKVIQLLEKENIRLDKNLDYTCGIFDNDDKLIATGSCYKNTLRCLAVDKFYQGMGFINKLISHLINEQYSRGNYHIFIYTKSHFRDIFVDLGFFEIEYIKNQIVFLENKKNGFNNFLKSLETSDLTKNQSIASLVMNCNPFTIGHQYLIEKASKENDIVHLFIVEEDASVFPYKIRKMLIEKGISHLSNIIIHSTGPYLISSSTFPSYFQKDSREAISSQANLDSHIFKKIANHLKINKRYVGTEPLSCTTKEYNKSLNNILNSAGIEVIEVPRIENNEDFISASKVRELLRNNYIEKIKEFVPKTTYDFLISKQGKEIISKIQQLQNVIHH